jgi:Domain of unknown function (DUF222)
MARRGLRLGVERGGLVPVTGNLLPEVAARLARLFEAHLSPKSRPVFRSAVEPEERVDVERIEPTDLANAELTGSGATSPARARSAPETSPYPIEPSPAAPGGRAPDVSNEPAPAPRDVPTLASPEEPALAAPEEPAPAAPDPRTMDQRRHDVLVGILDLAARHAETPMLGGAPPTVLVTVRSDDLTSERGAGFIDGQEAPISIRSVKQVACTGGIQNVTLDNDGRVLALGSVQRCFTASQRRAISVRDGGCLIPGCKVPASWCEIHHVIPAAAGGPTHTDNGVLLCWFHHRSIDTSGWEIRMVEGVPEVLAPPWVDASAQWRRAGSARTALLARQENRVTEESL